MRRAKEAGCEKRTMRGSDSDATDDKSAGRQRPTKPGKKKKYF